MCVCVCVCLCVCVCVCVYRAYTLTQLADVVWSIATMSVSQAGRVYSLLGVSEPVLAHAARRLCVEGQTARYVRHTHIHTHTSLVAWNRVITHSICMHT